MTTATNAAQQLGQLAKKFIQYWGRSRAEAWCADFAGFVAETSGTKLTRPFYGNVDALASDLLKRGWTKSASPHANDIFINPGTHTGIVESVDNGRITTIEGNTQPGNNWDNEQVRRIIRASWPGYYFLTPPAQSENTSEPKKSVQEIAKEVINGRWGNGDDRRKRLAAAGYDYDQIQAEVNKLASASKPKKSVQEIAKEVINGRWGNGDDRRKRLAAAGYDHNQIQAEVNRVLR